MVGIAAVMFTVIAAAQQQQLPVWLDQNCDYERATGQRSRAAAWKKLGLQHPCEFLKRLRIAGASRTTAMFQMERVYGLTPAGAEALFALQEQLLAYRHARDYREADKTVKPKLLRARDALVTAAAPKSAVPWLLILTEGELVTEEKAAIEKLISDPENIVTMMQLVPALSHLNFGAEDIAAHVMNQRPADALKVLRGFGFEEERSNPR
jgi:hypothetical protein